MTLAGILIVAYHLVIQMLQPVTLNSCSYENYACQKEQGCGTEKQGSKEPEKKTGDDPPVFPEASVRRLFFPGQDTPGYCLPADDRFLTGNKNEHRSAGHQTLILICSR
jgi:hypothetical protein